jgi:hypothetical protein
MNEIEQRLRSELSKAAEDDAGQDFVERLKTRLRHRRRGRLVLLALATLAGAALVTGLILEVVSLLRL